MRKIKVILLSSILAIPSLSACSFNLLKKKANGPISFEKTEYDIHSGDKVTIAQNYKDVTYSFVDLTLEGVNLDSKSGQITYTNIPNNSQVLYTATAGQYMADPVVLNLLSDVEVPQLSFVDLPDYICDGNIIYATSSTNSAIAYSIKQRVEGVSINTTTGQIKLTNAAVDGAEFTVVISSHGATNEKTFKVGKSHLVKSLNEKQVTEQNNKTALCFNLDFSDSDLGTKEVRNLISSRHVLGSDSYVFDATRSRLTVKKEALASFSLGENVLTIVTNKNMINVTVIVANKIVKTVEDIVSINDSIENLSGYYVLGNDIDLTSYLSPGGKGYDGGKGWTPIGIYHDVTDGTAFNETFKGTFDGNGHIISGYKVNRKDTLGFNSGLFGYIYNLGTVKNLGLVSSNDNTTASFAGAIAGFNEGKIINCWTDVNVSNDYGGTDYRIIGGFVGRNSGTIEGCYALGKVQGETQIGAFVGLNEGTIQHCYATKEGYEVFTTGSDPTNCTLFDTKADLIAHKAEMVLDEKYWDFSGDSYPTLKNDIEFFYPFSIDLITNDNEFVKGEQIPYEIKLYPTNLEVEFLPSVSVTTDDTNTTISGGKIISSASSKPVVNVKASINEGGLYLEDIEELKFFDATQSVVINNNFINNRVEPGERYALSAVVSPAGANQNVRWSISKNLEGVSIDGQYLVLDESAANNSDLTFDLIANSSGITDSLELTISIPNYLTTPLQVIYADDTKNLTYDLDGVNMSGAKLYLDGNQIEFSMSGSIMTINKDLIKSKPNENVGFKLLLSNGDVYRFYATYIPHNRYTISNLPAGAIALASKADFEQYFNVTDYMPTRYSTNYDKVYYLATDIDFGGAEIYSIGYESEATSEYRSFTGKLYGFGHKIRNAVINDNEKYHTLTAAQKADNYRTSKYGVGFFGSFAGEAYDILFDNISVNANSWNGAFAGMIGQAGIVENVSFINSEVKNAEGVDHSVDTLTTGRFAARNDGVMVGCSFNGSILGLLGIVE